MERRIKQVPLQKMQAPKLTKVAAYARVSSGKDAMLHSLSAQVSYYNELIQRHPGWVFCGVYADEALTGTKADRENFIRLLKDCRAGKVDMVITKSISRFARNTVTLLETVRELKLIGVDHVTVNADETVTFTFKSGIEITEKLNNRETVKRLGAWVIFQVPSLVLYISICTHRQINLTIAGSLQRKTVVFQQTKFQR